MDAPDNGEIERSNSIQLSEAISFIIGWASFWSWLMLLSASPCLFKGIDDGIGIFNSVSLLLMSALVVARAVFAFGAKWFEKGLILSSCSIFASAAAIAGTMMVFSINLVTVHVVWVPYAGAIIAGISSAWISTSWVNVLKTFNRYNMFLCVLVSFFIAALMELAISTSSQLFGIIFSALLPVLSAAFLTRSIRNGTARLPKEALLIFTSNQVQKREAISPVYILCLAAGILCYGVAGMIVRTLTGLSEVGDFQGATFAENCHIIGVALCTLLICTFVATRLDSGEDDGLHPLLIKAIFIIMALGILIPGLFTNVPLYISNFIMGIAMGCFEVLLLVQATLLTKDQRLSPFRTLGFAYGCMELASVIGYPLGSMLEGAMRDGTLQWSHIALVSLFILIIVSMTIFMSFDPCRLYFARTVRLSDEPNGRSIEATYAGDAVSKDGDTKEWLRTDYGLTDREAEIAELLSIGRDLPYIEEKLCISQGTAQTHARHIYQKMDVHNKQALINLIQEHNNRV